MVGARGEEQEEEEEEEGERGQVRQKKEETNVAFQTNHTHTQIKWKMPTMSATISQRPCGMSRFGYMSKTLMSISAMISFFARFRLRGVGGVVELGGASKERITFVVLLS